MHDLLLQDGEHAGRSFATSLPVEIVDAAIGTLLRYSNTRCALRSITRNTGPVESAFASQTHCPGFSRAAFSTIGRLGRRAGCAETEAAAHVRNPNIMSRVTRRLVQENPPEQVPDYELRPIVVRAMAAYAMSLMRS